MSRTLLTALHSPYVSYPTGSQTASSRDESNVSNVSSVSSVSSEVRPRDKREKKQVPETPHADILVAGSVAVDLSCDYADSRPSADLQLHVSNPAAIRQTVGGVGHNVALAAHRASPSTRVKLCTIVGEDM